MSDKKNCRPLDIDVAAAAADENAAEKGDAAVVEQKEDYGKFSSLQELLCAYNALQSEFTKRCQLIRQLQARLSDGNAQAQIRDIAADKTESGARTQNDCVAAEPSDASAARSSACDGETRLAEAVAVIAENIDECADYLASLPQIADAVILAYKKKLLGARACLSPRGMAVVMPAARPKTLADAKRLADEMLRNGR